jgi:hypothetical protein
MKRTYLILGWRPFSIQFLTILPNGNEVWRDWAFRIRRVQYHGTNDMLCVDKNGQFERLIVSDGREYR